MSELKKTAHQQTLTVANIEAWLVNYISELFLVPPNEVDVNSPLHGYGLDSSATIVLISDLSEYISYKLDPELLFEHSTIKAIANYCAETKES